MTIVFVFVPRCNAFGGMVATLDHRGWVLGCGLGSDRNIGYHRGSPQSQPDTHEESKTPTSIADALAQTLWSRYKDLDEKWRPMTTFHILKWRTKLPRIVEFRDVSDRPLSNIKSDFSYSQVLRCKNLKWRLKWVQVYAVYFDNIKSTYC